MSQQSSPSAPTDDRPSGDPWHAFGYIVAGVGFYGVLGWFADRWVGTHYLVAVGIILGAGFGLYMTFARFNAGVPGTAESSTSTTQTTSEQD